jgi:hypothetical protein
LLPALQSCKSISDFPLFPSIHSLPPSLPPF